MKFNYNYSSRFRILKGGKISLVVSALLGSTTLTFASPSGGTVTSGTANISQNGSTTNIVQSSNKATINWQDFSISKNETVNFKQPDANSITLNRVVGNEKSVIDGALNANGQVWILNSNGILFGKNASVNTAGLLATTKELSDKDFNEGKYNLKGKSKESVINMGTINVKDSGYASLLANSVDNQGNIKVVKGKITLTGAQEATINLNGNSLVSLTVTKGAVDTLVENKGAIIAEGGEIYLTTNAVDELLKGVVNNTGVLEANSFDDMTGKVEVFAHGGTANIAGTISAEAPISGDGGFIETSGKNVNIDKNTKISTKSKNGKTGTWLIDPTDIVVAASGGNMTGASVATSLNSTNVTIETTGPGHITVNDAITKTGSSATTLTLKSHNDINVNESISSTSGRLNVVLTADSDANNSGNINFGANGNVITKNGNFYVGTVSGSTDTVTASGQNFTMATGSFVNVGAGTIDVKVKGDITFANNSSATTTPTYSFIKSQTFVDNYYRYYNNGNSIYYAYTTPYISLTSTLGSILGGSTNSSIADIITASNVILNANGSIGSSSNAIKIQGSQTAGINNSAENANYRFPNYAQELSITNTAGSSYVNEINKQIFSSLSLNVGSSTTGIQNIQFMNDAGGNGTTGTGHVITNVNSGVMYVATGGINTKGSKRSDDTDNITHNDYDYNSTFTSVFPITVKLNASSIVLENNSMLTNDISYHSGSYGVGSSNNMSTYSPRFELNAQTITSANGNNMDGIYEINASNVNLVGPNIGNTTNALEVNASVLSVFNTGANTYLANTDYSTLKFSSYKTAGQHHILSSNGDFFNVITDGNNLLLNSISGTSDGENWNGTTGIYTATTYDKNNNTGIARNVSVSSRSGSILLGEDSVNTGSGSFTATLENTDSSNRHIKATNLYNAGSPVKQITAGSVYLNNYQNNNNNGIGADGYDIQIENGASSSQANLLEVYTYGGNVSVHELSENGFKNTKFTLNGSSIAQSVKIDYFGADDINITDNGSLLILDSDKVKLSEKNRNFELSVPSRTVQIGTKSSDGFTGNSLSTGYYKVNASRIKLDGDVVTNGGELNLSSSYIDLMRSVRLDSNADDISNTTSTGSSGYIFLNGNISAKADGYSLIVDSNSTDNYANYMQIYSNTSNNAGFYLKNITFTSKGSSNTNDGAIYYYGGSYYLNGNFTSTGNSYFQVSNLIIDTEQGNINDAGNITFNGQNLYTYYWGNNTFNTSTTATGKNGGNVNLYDTYYHSELSSSSFNIDASGGTGGISGNITLPSIGTIQNNASGTQTYKGNIITLYGNLLSNFGNISLTGDVQVANNITIDTWNSTNNVKNATAGSVTINGGLSATAENKSLNINTSTNTGSNDYNTSDGNTHTLSDYYTHNAGAVTITGGTTAGATLSSLNVDASKGGDYNNAENGIITLSGITTSGNQSYVGGTTAINGALNANQISIETKTANTTVGGDGIITANSLGLKGNATTYNLAPTAAHEIGILAASGVKNINFLNKTALRLGTASTIEGITATGTINIATKSEDLTIEKNITTTDNTTSAIVLNAGKDTSAGTSTGGNIIVSGTQTVTTGTAGRATFYAGSIENSTGLSNLIQSGNSRYNSDEIASNFTASLGEDSYAIYREKAIIKVSAANKNITYGNNLPTSYTVSYLGYVNGDVENDLGILGTASFSTQSGTTSSSGNRVVGDYNVTFNGGLTNKLGYTFEDNSEITNELSITAKELTVSGVVANDRVYNATTRVVLSNSGSLNGLIGEDSVSFLTSASFEDKNAGVDKTVNLNYTLSGTDASNYSFRDDGSVTATIFKKDITVNVSAEDKTYNANTNATATLSSSGIIGEDSVSFSGNSYFADKNVGENKTVTASNLTKSGEDSNNYNITNATATDTATIFKKDITVNVSAEDKTYNANTNATATLSSSGIIGEDSVSFSGNSYFADKNVGENKTVTASNLTKSGEDSNNYNITNATATDTATIFKKDITVNVSAEDKTYNANTNATATLSSSGIIGEDSVSFSGNSYFADKNAGVDKTVTASNLTKSGEDSNNYNITNATATDTATIFKKDITVNVSAEDKTYNANTNATATLSSSGIIGEDSVSFSGNSYFADKNAGVDKTVTASNLTKSGEDSNNYNITNATATDTATIFKKDITVNVSAEDKTYNANTNATATLSSSGIIGEDSVSFSGNSYFADKNAGENKTVTASNLTKSGEDSNNYNITNATATDTATIFKKDITVNVSAEDKTYNANTNATATLSSSGIIGEDSVSFSGNSYFADKNAGENKTVTASNLTKSGEDSNNYNITNATATDTATIFKKDITVNVSAEDKTYNANTNATATLSSSGIIGEDSVSFSGNSYFADKNAGVDKTVTASNLTKSGEDSNNYNITNATATDTATIFKKDITVNVSAEDKTYNANTNATATLSSSGIIGEDSVSFSGNSYFADKNAGVDKTVTASNLTKSGEDSNNYNITNATATDTATIFKKDITVNVSAEDKTYNANTNATATLSSSGIIGEDSVSFSGNSYFADKNVGENKTVTASNLTKSGEDSNNYNITNATATDTATIFKKDIIAGALEQFKIYGEKDPFFSYYTVGLVNGDTLTGSVSREEGENVGQYAIKKGSLLSTNYNVSFVNGTLDIRPNVKVLKVEDPKIVIPTLPVLPQSNLNLTKGFDIGFGEIQKVTVVSNPLTNEQTKMVTLQELKAMQNEDKSVDVVSVIKVSVGQNSLIHLVNAGVNLGEGLEQEFYVVADRRN